MPHRVLFVALALAATAATSAPLAPETLRAPPGTEILSIDHGDALLVGVRAAGVEGRIRITRLDALPAPVHARRTVYRGNARADVLCDGCTPAEVEALASVAQSLASQAEPLLGEAPPPPPEGTARAFLLTAWLAVVALALAWALVAHGRTLALGDTRVRTVVLVGACAGFLVRAWVADATAISSDETWLAAFPPPWQFAATPEISNNPPLYPALAWPALAATGGDPQTARFLSVVLGTFTVGLLGALAFTWMGPRAALVATGLAALHPILVAASAANRAYALAILVGTAALGALARAIATPTPRHRWIAAALLGALPWTHYGTLPALGAFALWLLVEPRRGPLKDWLAPLALAAVLALPAALLAWEGGRSKSAEDFGTGEGPTATSLWATGAAVLLGLEPPSLLDHRTGRAPPLAQVLALVPILSLLAAGLLRAWKRKGNVGVLGAGLLGLVGIAWPLALAGRLATVRDVHLFLAVAPTIIGVAWLARERWIGVVIGLAALLALTPGLRVLLVDDDPLGAKAAGRMLEENPSLHALVVGHAAAANVRAELSSGASDRVRILAYCGRASLPDDRAVVVVRGYCTLASLGIETRRCEPLPDAPALVRCPAAD